MLEEIYIPRLDKHFKCHPLDSDVVWTFWGPLSILADTQELELSDSVKVLLPL
jgi:hypothetical protein